MRHSPKNRKCSLDCLSQGYSLQIANVIIAFATNFRHSGDILEFYRVMPLCTPVRLNIKISRPYGHKSSSTALQSNFWSFVISVEPWLVVQNASFFSKVFNLLILFEIVNQTNWTSSGNVSRKKQFNSNGAGCRLVERRTDPIFL